MDGDIAVGVGLGTDIAVFVIAGGAERAEQVRAAERAVQLVVNGGDDIAVGPGLANPVADLVVLEEGREACRVDLLDGSITRVRLPALSYS
jgi:hypothetical protein